MKYAEIRLSLFLFFIFLSSCGFSQTFKEDSTYFHENYTKTECMIPMRDGIKLFTSIYTPKDESQKYPILFERTPYSSAPYGENIYTSRIPGLIREKFIFVTQDVRGRFMSEGNFEEMTPHKPVKKTKQDVDESSDAYDAVEWLIKNLKNNNGRVGIHGVSYPGFFASASLPDAHPAVKAVSPQAPVTDEFIGDDVNHNGAFFLMDNFDFYGYFDHPRTGPWKKYPPIFEMRRKNVYDFFLGLGSIRNAEPNYFKEKSKIWSEMMVHTTYDDYWKMRNIRPHLKNIKPAVLVVGGWFDAEDLFGALRTYEAIEKQSPGNKNHLVMGPWTHGAWRRKEWSKYATLDFGSNTNQYFKDEIELKFFNFYLKDKGQFDLAEATIFETGSNQWKTYDAWPPKDIKTQNLYFQSNGKLSFETPLKKEGYDEYTADPAKPVPYVDSQLGFRDNNYMAADQRYAYSRPDVLTYQTEILTEDIILAGPLKADLFVSLTGTDADFIVKLIDVLPDDTPNPNPNPRGILMAGLQQLVRADVMRGKFRKSFEKPEAFIPNQVSEVKFAINDVAHAFKKGHRIMIQVQSSWFPLVDRNPQKFIEISKALDSDFSKETHRVYLNAAYPSHVEVSVVTR